MPNGSSGLAKGFDGLVLLSSASSFGGHAGRARRAASAYPYARPHAPRPAPALNREKETQPGPGLRNVDFSKKLCALVSFLQWFAQVFEPMVLVFISIPINVSTTRASGCPSAASTRPCTRSASGCCVKVAIAEVIMVELGRSQCQRESQHQLPQSAQRSAFVYNHPGRGHLCATPSVARIRGGWSSPGPVSPRISVTSVRLVCRKAELCCCLWVSRCCQNAPPEYPQNGHLKEGGKHNSAFPQARPKNFQGPRQDDRNLCGFLRIGRAHL